MSNAVKEKQREETCTRRFDYVCEINSQFALDPREIYSPLKLSHCETQLFKACAVGLYVSHSHSLLTACI